MEATEIVSQLSAGRSVKFNQRSVHPDLKAGLVWGTDEYGCDVLAAVSSGSQDEYLKRAADWVLAEQAGPHPAEYSW